MTVYRRPDPIPRPVNRPTPIEMPRAPIGVSSPQVETGSILTRDLFLLILRDGYPEGSTLPVEADLCARFRVSRTALRESIKRLEAKRVLTVRRRSGTVVAAREDWALLDADLMHWQAEAGETKLTEELWQALVLLLPEASASGGFAHRLDTMEAEAKRMANPLLQAVALRAITHFKTDGRGWLDSRLTSIQIVGAFRFSKVE